ncbi:MAG: hypothetical protein ABIQ39_13365, partial [Ilumatobacteraceae bacterium]
MIDRRLGWVLRGLLALPLLIALIVLCAKHWTPVLDLAMTELRVRDVGGRHTPLIGLPGRIGTFPNQGSHPGPLSFYLLAPVYRLFGSTSFGLEVATAVINVAAAWTAIWIARRRGGRRLLVAVGAMLAVTTAWFGASVLTQPWNPYLPLVSFVVVLLAAWAVLDGDHVMLVPLVVAATLCAQTHVPYLTLAVSMCVVAFAAVGWRWWSTKVVARPEVRSVLIAVAVAVLLWLPPLIDQLRNTPGNISMLRHHFLNPPEAPTGFGTGIRTILAHFDLWHLMVRLFGRSGDYFALVADLDGGSWKRGLVVVVVWLTLAAVALRMPDRRPLRMHLVAAVATVVAVLSAERIFGKVWYYLTLWAWVIALLAVLASLWTAVQLIDRHRRQPLPLLAAGMAVMLIAVGLFSIDALRVEPPEARLSHGLAAVVGPTAAALDAGVAGARGHDGTYVVLWADAYYFGSQGYGLISELERRGFHAGATITYRVPVTNHRVVDLEQVTAEVVLVTGVNIPIWRAKPAAVQAADFEPRNAAELAEFERL